MYKYFLFISTLLTVAILNEKTEPESGLKFLTRCSEGRSLSTALLNVVFVNYLHFVYVKNIHSYKDYAFNIAKEQKLYLTVYKADCNFCASDLLYIYI